MKIIKFSATFFIFVLCVFSQAQSQLTEITLADSKCTEDNKALIGKWSGIWSYAGPAILEILSIESKDKGCFAKIKIYLEGKDSKKQKIHSLFLADGLKIKIPQTSIGDAVLWGDLDKVKLTAELYHQWTGKQAGFAIFKKE